MLRLLIRYQEKTIDPQDGHYPCWSSLFGVGPNRYDLTDLIGFLVFHGDTLLFLDLNAFPHIRTILYLCSLLTDLLLQPRLENRTLQPPPTPKTNTDNSNAHPEHDDAAPVSLTNRLHNYIQYIGLHGRMHASALQRASPQPLSTHFGPA